GTPRAKGDADSCGTVRVPFCRPIGGVGGVRETPAERGRRVSYAGAQRVLPGTGSKSVSWLAQSDFTGLLLRQTVSSAGPGSGPASSCCPPPVRAVASTTRAAGGSA